MCLSTPALLHAVTGRSLGAPYPDNLQQAVFGMGCFWGAERLFWQQPGVWITAAGYAGGSMENPSYREVCSGKSGHAEVVLVVFNPLIISYHRLLELFWQSHDPTQGMRQGNDIGSQYRSVIYCVDEQQLTHARASRAAFTQRLRSSGYGAAITTDILPLQSFYYAEPEHQQYLAKHPNGYCGLQGLKM